MKRLFSLIAAVFAAFTLCAAPEPFRPGERVVFFGDSITHNGNYIGFLQLMLDSRGIRDTRMINSGRSGGTAEGGLRRIRHDVIAGKPARVFVLFGMNDIHRELYKENTPENLKRRAEELQAYTKNMTKIVDQLQQAGLKVILMTPTPYDQYQPEGKSDHCNEPGLSDAAGIVRKLAAEKKLELIELHPYMTQILKAHPELRLCGRDRIHPLFVGHMVMASLIMDQLGMAGPTAEVTVDAADGKVNARFAAVSQVRTSPDKVSFHYAPERMALRLPRWRTDLEKVYPFNEKFNRETLKVTGLKPGNYTVSAGKTRLGDFSDEALAKGIDLGELNTPNRARAEKAMENWKKSGDNDRTLRSLEMARGIALRFDPKTGPDTASIGATLDRWLARFDPKKSSFGYWKFVVKKYKDNAGKEKEIREKFIELRRSMAENARPVPYDILIQKKAE
ncbi:MAG: SGNH/GDSL hydrolase family protein [Lentisphaeria bacterium]|nr:SGNH/GDSL hydrolase family protein [Lentisphaeria bacterium]